MRCEVVSSAKNVLENLFETRQVFRKFEKMNLCSEINRHDEEVK